MVIPIEPFELIERVCEVSDFSCRVVLAIWPVADSNQQRENNTLEDSIC